VSAGFVSVPGAKHAMLRHGRTFETYAADFVTATLLGDEPRTAAVAAVLGGAAVVDG
jgi:plasmid stability protein